MATINSQNNTLTTSSGSGSFVGSNNPILTSADFGNANTLKIPSSTSPAPTVTGSIAIDTLISNFNGMLTYRNGSQTLIAPSVPTADLATATNGQLIGYNSAGQKLSFVNAVGVSTTILGYATGTSSSIDTTTSTSAVNTSLTVSYTPKSPTSILYIFVSGAGSASSSGGISRAQRYATYTIRRTTQTASNLAIIDAGRVNASSSVNAATSYYQVSLGTTEVAGNVNLHTYVLQHNTPVANLTTSFLSSTCRSFIVVMELKV